MRGRQTGSRHTIVQRRIGIEKKGFGVFHDSGGRAASGKVRFG